MCVCVCRSIYTYMYIDRYMDVYIYVDVNIYR